MMNPTLLVMLVIFILFLLFNWIKIVKENERLVIFRFGRPLNKTKGPGIIFVLYPIDRAVRVSQRTVVLDVQDIITKDNVSVKVNAVVYYNVLDPNKSMLEIQDYQYAISQFSQNTLRSMLGQVELDKLLSEREKLNSKLQTIIDQHTAPWGIKVSMVEIKPMDFHPGKK
ncbi:MAG: SPFH domain-containing protein [Acidobacteria bacterium]|jgi:regulator of protease activity HflC (stomatin/prohibitin superfamily)|nr:SPFH domain-containing protein [Acidobacteriota bacterium]